MEQTSSKNDFSLEIESLAYGPHGIGRLDNQVIMVPATVPGDKISARLTHAKGNYAFGEIIRLLQPSPLRQTPPCPYINDCGGCPWQQVQYEAQLKAKEQSASASWTVSSSGRLSLHPASITIGAVFVCSAIRQKESVSFGLFPTIWWK
jgi:tRNA/tmRNA/rRNA uracil-C5-methylase (TrmA/RlmC/RlmD family)